MDALYESDNSDRISGQLAGGGFDFEAVRSRENQLFTAWRLGLYGIIAGGDSDSPKERSRETHVIACHRDSRAASSVQAIFRH